MRQINASRNEFRQHFNVDKNQCRQHFDVDKNQCCQHFNVIIEKRNNAAKIKKFTKTHVKGQKCHISLNIKICK